ncbi:MAG: dihydrodipicolinate synthase family protein, partial [Lentisphaerae bacterium]|nr:dihydrodipicolinate synthase family protein [Lentisphaerota bacterium]
MKKTRFKGLIAAAFTPFKKNGELDLDKIPGLVESALTEKLTGLFVCGSTGEFASMTSQERILTAEVFLNSAGGILPIIVHVGSCSIEESIMLAEHAQENGAAAVAALAPFYFKVGRD